MKIIKTLLLAGFWAFLTPANAKGLLGVDLTYTHGGGYAYSFTISIYSDSALNMALIDFGTNNNYDTVAIPQSQIQVGKYYGSATVTHIFPGPGTYNINIVAPNWTSSIDNITHSPTQVFYANGKLVISPFITANESVLFGASQLSVSTVGSFYTHDLQVNNPDSDSLVYTIFPLVAAGYLLPSQMGGSESISASGMLQVSFPANGFYTIGLRVSDYRETNPGQYILVGEAFRVMTIEANTVGLTESTFTNWLVYPNPATDYIQFPQNESYDVLVFDMQGKQVLQQRAVNDKLNITMLAAGTYSLYAVNNKNGNGSAVKFTKQ